MSNNEVKMRFSSIVYGAIGGVLGGGILGCITGLSRETLASSTMWGVFYGLLAGIFLGSALHAMRQK